MREKLAYIYVYKDIPFLEHTLIKHNIKYEHSPYQEDNIISLQLNEQGLSELMYYLAEDNNNTKYLRELLQQSGKNVFYWR